MGRHIARNSWFCGWLLASLTATSLCQAETIVRLTNGYELRGNAQQWVGLNKNAAAAGAGIGGGLPLLMVDDGLKRTFVHNRAMVASTADSGDLILSIPIWQAVARSSNQVAAVTANTWATPFNAHGRRWINTATANGPLRVLQGITEINARYVQVQGLQTAVSYEWEMRLATDSIPAATFQRIFEEAIERTDLDRRLEVVNFFIEAERFADARRALQAVIADFPEANHLSDRLKALTQREARQILNEALVRRDAGQYQLALTMLQNFTNVQGIARERRLEAQDFIAELTGQAETAGKLLAQLEQQISQLPAGQDKGLNDFVQVMRQEMSFDTFTRLNDYQRLGSEATIPLENRVSLAIGGWLQGPGSGMQNLAVARSLIAVRQLVSEYLAASDALQRAQLLKQLEDLEGARPEYIARLLPTLPPPVPLPIMENANPPAGNPQNPAAGPAPQLPDVPAIQPSVQPVTTPAGQAPADQDPAGADANTPAADQPPADAANPADADPQAAGAVPEAAAGNMGAAADADKPPGYFELEIETNRGPVTYVLQLPPEYHPLRKYPTVVALHPLDTPPQAEIQWWSGRYDVKLGMRTGQASRRGYIVVAPKWTRDGQSQYEYTPIEHHRVLAALRDAMRRVSIDTDRVYLTGHLAGSTAAWDIALSHPDLWAGLVCIGGTAGKYIMFYGPNGKYVPMYFVTGEMAASSSLIQNGTELDDYMKPGYDVMVTLYRGHGDGYFYEDINNIFDWMRLSSHRRSAPPRDIETVTMRLGDQFFWWLELPSLLESVPINPVLFDQEKRRRAGPISARVGDNNQIRIGSAPSQMYTVLLSPEMGIDMNQPISIRANGRNFSHEFAGSIEFMLEDARRRGDRQHVYWDAVTIP